MALLTPDQNIPNKQSGFEEWIAWHKTLASYLGKKTGNALWIKAWGKRGSDAANTRELREYLENQGIKISTTAWDDIVDISSDFGDELSEIFSFGKTVTYVLVGGTVVVVLMLAYNLAKQPVAAIKEIASLKKLR